MLTGLLFLVGVWCFNAAAVPTVWRHKWTTVGEMIFSHGGNNTIISDKAHAFLAANYPMVAFADCYGNNHGHGVTQEEAALFSAKKLRSHNPSIRNVIYFKSHLETQLTGCSSANETWAKHRAQWLLHGDDGQPLLRSGHGFLDVRMKAVQDFWIEHLLGVLDNKDSSGKPLIDGVFVDGCPGEHTGFPCKGTTNCLSKEHWEIYSTSLFKMTSRLQHELDSRGHEQTVICNGMDDDYNLQHAQSTGGSMVDHFG